MHEYPLAVICSVSCQLRPVRAIADADGRINHQRGGPGIRQTYERSCLPRLYRNAHGVSLQSNRSRDCISRRCPSQSLLSLTSLLRTAQIHQPDLMPAHDGSEKAATASNFVDLRSSVR
jgi:hypothetical protein